MWRCAGARSVVDLVRPARERAGRGTAGTSFPPPAPEFDESGCGDRVLHEGIPEHVEGGMARHAGTQISEQRAGAVHEGGSTAGNAATDRGVAFRLARYQ